VPELHHGFLQAHGCEETSYQTLAVNQPSRGLLAREKRPCKVRKQQNFYDDRTRKQTTTPTRRRSGQIHTHETSMIRVPWQVGAQVKAALLGDRLAYHTQ
jgi:hypothetical protein